MDKTHTHHFSLHLPAYYPYIHSQRKTCKFHAISLKPRNCPVDIPCLAQYDFCSYESGWHVSSLTLHLSVYNWYIGETQWP